MAAALAVSSDDPSFCWQADLAGCMYNQINFSGRSLVESYPFLTENTKEGG